MAVDDQSSASIAPRGIDLVAARAGSFTRGASTPASVAISATGALAVGGTECAGHGTARLDLVVSVVGTTVTVTIETSFDNGATDTWRTVAAFAAQTAAGTTRKVFTGLDRWVRANVTAETGGATFSLSGELV